MVYEFFQIVSPNLHLTNFTKISSMQANSYQWHQMPFKYVSTTRPFRFFTFFKTLTILGTGCGTVGRAVASETIGPGFACNDRQFLKEHLCTVKFMEKKKRSWTAHVKLKWKTFHTIRHALGFKLSTSNSRVSSHNHKARENLTKSLTNLSKTYLQYHQTSLQNQ